MSSQPQCPKCAAQLKDDYGMVECPSCGIYVFVDMDGIAHISDESSELPEAAHLPSPAPEQEAQPEPLNSPTQVQEASVHGFTFHSSPDLMPLSEQEEAALAIEPLGSEPVHEPQFDDQAAVLDSSDDEVHAPIEMSQEPTQISADQMHELGGDLDMDALLGFNQPVSEDPPPEEFGTPGDPLGLNEYANSELSQAKDGLLSFKILISGIDSKEMRETLRSALDDQRFGWNPNELISRISMGVLQIDNVASVKAVILINRIKRMPVRVRWEQYAITKMEPH